MEEAAEALETKLNLNCLKILNIYYTKQVFIKQIFNLFLKRLNNITESEILQEQFYLHYTVI